MYKVKIKPGLKFKIDRIEYTIVKCLDGVKIQVLREGYQKGEIFTKYEMISLIDQGRLEFEVKGKNIRPPDKGSFSTSYLVNDFEKVQRKDETIFRFKVIEPLLKGRRTRLDVKNRVLEIIEQCIEDTYLNQQRVTIDELRWAVQSEIINENEYRRGDNIIYCPSYSTFTRIVSKIPEFELVWKRMSKRNAEVKFNPIGQGVKVSYPLERVEIDATVLDIIIIFADGTFIERPHLVMAIDKLTRDIPGFCICFGSVGWAEVSQCLRHILSDKSYIKDKYPFIENEWNTFGVPQALVIDNGLAFKNHPMKDACYQLGVVLEYAPPKVPEWKASIERFLGTTTVNFVQKNPGTTRSNTQKLAEGENPKERARIPFNIFVGLMHKWLVDVYRQDINRGAGGIPAKLWEKYTDDFPVDWPNSSHELPILLGRVNERMITNKGIELNNLRYNSMDINGILKKFSKQNKGAEQKFKVKYDPQNIGSIFLYDHMFIHDWIRVQCTNPDYAEGLSEWEHDEAIKLARKKYGTIDVVSLAKSKAFLRNQASFWESKNSRGKAAKLNSDHEIFSDNTGIFNNSEVKVNYSLPEATENMGKLNNISDIGTNFDFSEILPPLPVSYSVNDFNEEVKPVSKNSKAKQKNSFQSKCDKSSIPSNTIDDTDFSPEDLEGFDVIYRIGD